MKPTKVLCCRESSNIIKKLLTFHFLKSSDYLSNLKYRLYNLKNQLISD